MSPALALAAAGALWGRAAAFDCPAGTTRVKTDNPYEPSRCAAEGAQPALSAAPGVRGFPSRPRCPRGTRPVPTPKGLQPYRCERGAPAGAAAPAQKKRYAAKGELSFERPAGWRLSDAWGDSPPTLYLSLDRAGAGKPVTVVVTRYDAGRPGWQPLEEAFAAEREWRGAKDAGRGAVAGRTARFSAVAGESRTAYVPAGQGRYYAFVYSAPPEAYAAHESAFSELLDSLELEAR